MALLAKSPIVLINLTPNRPKLTGLELSTIRSHNAHRHSARRDRSRGQRQSIDEEPARRVTARQSHDLALQLFTADNAYRLGPRVRNESIRSDPFDCFPVRTNEKIILAIDHYATVISSLYGPYLSQNEGITNGCLEVVLPQAINNEYFFHALVAQSRTISLMAQGKSALQDPAVIFHRGQALVGIKAALSNVDDDVLPLAVIHMVSLDWRLGLNTAMHQHAKGLRRILRVRNKARPSTPASIILEMLMTAATNSGLIAEEGKELSESSTTKRPSARTHETPRSGADSTPDSTALSFKVPPQYPNADPSRPWMPLGFKMISAYGMVSNATLRLVKSVNERVHQQLWSYGWNHMPPREEDGAWINLELQMYRQVLANNKGLLDGWLRWGMLAYIFQCYSYAYRKTIGHKILERLNEIIRPPEETNVVKTKELLKEFREDQKGRHRRNCAIWVLMCLAAASARRFKDDGGTSAGLEGPTDKASMMLMARVRSLLDFDATEPRNVDLEWEVVEAVVLQFWCPPWILKDWETMWKEQPGTNIVRAAAYFRVWHHWASAILPEDASTV